MNTLFTTSPDGTRVAYECIDTGPAIVLLHGGGRNRHEWHDWRDWLFTWGNPAL